MLASMAVREQFPSLLAAKLLKIIQFLVETQLFFENNITLPPLFCRLLAKNIAFLVSYLAFCELYRTFAGKKQKRHDEPRRNISPEGTTLPVMLHRALSAARALSALAGRAASRPHRRQGRQRQSAVGAGRYRPVSAVP